MSKLGISKKTDATEDRAIWKRIPIETRWMLVAAGLVHIDEDTGAPKLAEINGAVVQRINGMVGQP